MAQVLILNEHSITKNQEESVSIETGNLEALEREGSEREGS